MSERDGADNNYISFGGGDSCSQTRGAELTIQNNTMDAGDGPLVITGGGGQFGSTSGPNWRVKEAVRKLEEWTSPSQVPCNNSNVADEVRVLLDYVKPKL